MRKFLPDYMVPTFFIPLETMPLTTNGKVDKKCLPVPDINSTRNYIAPRSDREKSILEVFSDVLGMQVGLSIQLQYVMTLIKTIHLKKY